MAFRSTPFEQMDRRFEQTRRALGRTRPSASPTLAHPFSATADAMDVLSTTEANVGMEPTDEAGDEDDNRIEIE